MSEGEHEAADPAVGADAIRAAAMLLARDDLESLGDAPAPAAAAVRRGSRRIAARLALFASFVISFEVACLVTAGETFPEGRSERPDPGSDRSSRPFVAPGPIRARNTLPEIDPMRLQPASLTLVAASSFVLGSNALGGDSLLFAWGSNTWGQIQLPQDSSDIVDIGAWLHGFGLRFDGTLVLWGSDGQGQAQSQGGTKFSQVATSGLHNVALTQSGAVQAWGYNNFGQIDVPGSLGAVIAVGAGDYHSFAIKSDGTLTAWGRDDQGQCVIPEGLGAVREINGGYWHSCAVTTGGLVRVWGGNVSDSGAASNQAILPASISGARVSAARAGGFHSLALRTDGTVVAWGDNSRGQTDVPTDLRKVVQVSAGSLHSAALTQDGTVVCWGDNSKGACDVPQGMGRVAKIVAAYDCTIVLSTAENCPNDLDGDGEVGGADVALLLIDFGPCP